MPLQLRIADKQLNGMVQMDSIEQAFNNWGLPYINRAERSIYRRPCRSRERIRDNT